jgi:hypothetical protein
MSWWSSGSKGPVQGFTVTLALPCCPELVPVGGNVGGPRINSCNRSHTAVGEE